MKLFDLLRRNTAKSPAPPAIAPEAAPAVPVRAPSFVFLNPAGAAKPWAADAARGRIHGIARALAAAVPAGSTVGLIFPSGQDLVETWFACVNAGLQPLILQYPTRKQSRAYWYDSIASTIAIADLRAIIADDPCAALDLPTERLQVLRLTDLATDPVLNPGPLLPESFSIVQLSSGTTGYRKAMVFTSGALARHAADYNRVLQLNPALDRIVSWLPLYHDMGYVACFVMPILLGIEVVMMDPVTWVDRPERLFDAIEKHAGTICYMPNFGFEVMTRAPARALPTIRHWISCSEPVSAVTSAKFCAHISADPARFAPCYAMAENLFAVTLGRGFETRVIDGADIVSCGRPIPGVELKIVDGEIYVRSPTSLANYLGGDDIRDADGFYPTGDLGQLIDGELYVAGRKGDVLIQAGRKFMLSDIDLKLNEAYPEIRGRAATLAVPNPLLGTETPLILIEAIDFFDRRDAADIAQRMIDLTGMDQVEVAFVPPRFLTKTSSGKINRRKTRDHWHAVQQARHATAGPRDVVQQLQDSFAHIDWSKPIRDVLDSLSRTIVQVILEPTTVAFDAAQSLDQLAAALRTAAPPDIKTATRGIRIVSFADRRLFDGITPEDLARMGDALGCPVTLEHVCLPPSPVILSDVIFHDWFQPQLDQEAFAHVDAAMERLKNASVIVTDNIAELHVLYVSTYPVLSHNLERDPRADLICIRWPNYTTQHHKLPVTIAAGNDLPLAATNIALGQLGRYLDTPIFRIASVGGYGALCADWEYHPPAKERRAASSRAALLDALTQFLAAKPSLRRTEIRPEQPIALSDTAHFCAVMARRPSLDKIIDRYDSFYICGTQSSLPYLRQRLDQLGKRYVQLPTMSAETIERLPEKYDCVIGCGAFGTPPRALPAAMFQAASLGWRTRKLDIPGEETSEIKWLNEFPAGAADWFHAFELGRQAADQKAWYAAQRER